ncbi:hypothetical protein NADFUDRAFT_44966 [Nadsonia fulvescens var. elongata DSM 6958]|uniref:Uncharacterized protein n=1 Tax=Nadsonia fulvescens var. elongata DSM 6958 TaxID=857566 RepID=A0A1E3PSI1_9ASCO|nr:hypothetical protein NADFUDRAFT_44966 [Nadsonia fulvescens var. elongata DSM 6958]
MFQRGLADFISKKLLQSESFHHFVRTVHAKINGLPNPTRTYNPLQQEGHSAFNKLAEQSQKLNQAKRFGSLFLEELKRDLKGKK